jgi:osmotically-inducible protein OsmY
MKSVQALKVAASAMLVAVSLNVYAQDASAPAATTTPDARQQLQQSRSQYRTVRAANRALARKVRGALARARGVTVSKIVVRAKDGAITLTGSVPQQQEIDRATEVAKGVDGVTSVKNQLTIRPVGG